MERGFSLIKRIEDAVKRHNKTDFYIAFSDMIFRYLLLNHPEYIGEKSLFFNPSFSA